MEIEEAKRKKKTAEIEIAGILNQFIKETGLDVFALDFEVQRSLGISLDVVWVNVGVRIFP